MTRAALAVLLVLSSCTPATAQDLCDWRWQMHEWIRAFPWEEVPLIFLPVGDGRELEVWVNPETGSWTLLEAGEDGRACLIWSGWDIDFGAMRQAG